MGTPSPRLKLFESFHQVLSPAAASCPRSSIAMRDPVRRAHQRVLQLRGYWPRSSASTVACALAGQPSDHHRQCTASTGDAAKQGPTAKVATSLRWSPTPALDTVRPDSSCALSGVGLAAQKAAWQVAPALSWSIVGLMTHTGLPHRYAERRGARQRPAPRAATTEESKDAYSKRGPGCCVPQCAPPRNPATPHGNKAP